MKFWFDLTNSPHVLFFSPFFEELKSRGHEYIITSRSHSQTISLLKNLNINSKIIDKHRGSNIISKSLGFFSRNRALKKALFDEKIDVAVSHQSPYCMKVAYDLGISKRVYIFDNDMAKLQNFLAFHYSTKIFCPEYLNNDFEKYPGLKEGIYLWNFKPELSVLENFNFKKEEFVIMRPAPWSAQYYKRKKEVLGNWIDHLKSDYDIVFFPRNEGQREYYSSNYGDYLNLVEKALDAPSLICYSKFLVGAGGTMNREAVILGKPVVSLYDSELLSVDKWLISNGLLHHNRSPEEFDFKSLENKKYKGELLDKGKASFEKIMGYLVNA